MLFDLASITKPVATATSVMILVERGKIRLRDRVKDFIPEFAQGEPVEKSSLSSSEDIRIWHLLTHTSGLQAYTDPEEAAGKSGKSIVKTRDLAAQIARLKRGSPPGTQFVYSCLNYIVLASLVQEVSGQTLAEFAEENIFRPLGMTKNVFQSFRDLEIGLRSDNHCRRDLASGYRERSSGPAPRRNVGKRRAFFHGRRSCRFRGHDDK